MASPATFVLAPISAVYGTVTRVRSALYRAGLLTTHRVAAPVISVGNITTGGTGKTPLVAWVAGASAREGRRVCVLTRGYGRINPSGRVIVSDGERLLANAREGGDEPRLLAEMLRGSVAVISDADRVAAARWASENFKSEVFVLDDGFQHLRLARDLDIVTMDGANPWGGGRLLPHGRLRESPHALKRADCVIISRSNQAEDAEALRNEVQQLTGGRVPVLCSEMRTVRVRPLSTDDQSVGDSLPDSLALRQPLAAFCALGNPESFFAHVRHDGYALSHTRAYPDHHAYTQRDLDRLCAEAEANGAQTLLTTAKDAVKLSALRFALPCYVLDIEFTPDDEDALLGLIRRATSRATNVPND